MIIHEGRDKTPVSSIMIWLVLSLRFERPTYDKDKCMTKSRYVLCMSFVFCFLLKYKSVRVQRSGIDTIKYHI